MSRSAARSGEKKAPDNPDMETRARRWLPYQGVDVDGMTDADIREVIELKFEGGWAGFVLDRGYRSARTNAFCAMSMLASRMSDKLRPVVYSTPAGSNARVALADARTSMNDQRAALSIAAARGCLDGIDRDGFRRATPGTAS